MNNIIEVKQLSKTYSKKKALDKVSLNLKPGSIVGILGPNGSGKTTLLKILAGILRPSSGEVLIDNNKPNKYTKSIVAYLPDRNSLYTWMKIKDATAFFNDFYADFNLEKANNLISSMHLDHDAKITSLSKGMLEKLNIALVLSREAKVYILDEPIAGVDPVARDQILNTIIENYNKDSLVLVTTQLVRDMEAIFDEVIFLKDGSVYLEGASEELRVEKGMQIEDIYKEIYAVEEDLYV